MMKVLKEACMTKIGSIRACLEVPPKVRCQVNPRITVAAKQISEDKTTQLNIEGTSRSKGASCIASTCTILESQRFNTRPFSICADSRASALISNHARVLHLCCKIVCRVEY